MACKTETITIGEHEFSVTQWPATRSMLTKFRLIKTFGATLALIAGESSTKSKKKNQDLDSKALSEGMSLFFKDNSPEEVVSLMKECIIGIACDDKRITDSSYEELFSGENMGMTYQVFIFVLKVNYAHLMKGQLASRLLAKVKENL